MIPINDNIVLTRFLEAQNQTYLKALAELRNGKKESHWMWFIFPQLKGLGQSETARFYAIENLDEATAYIAHPILGKHLIESAQAVLDIQNKTAREIFGSPDDMKLRSSMTLFASVPGADAVFGKVIDTYYHGLHDERTLQLLLQHKLQ